MHVKVYHNVTESADRSYIPMCDGWRPGSTIKFVHEMGIDPILTRHDDATLNYVWSACNGAPGFEKQSDFYYANKVRSLSVGDTILIVKPSEQIMYAVASRGFELLYRIAD